MTIPETRVWQKFDKDWKCVHSHRSKGVVEAGEVPPSSGGNASAATDQKADTE